MPEPQPPVAPFCPRCRSPLSRQTGGVCLICLGEDALRLAGISDSSISSVNTPAPAKDNREMSGSPAQRTIPRHLGAYELIEEIGRGGMGVVYAARHTALERIVALKVITGGRFATVEQETRFVREAQTAGRLRHPNIVSILDAGYDSGVAYYTMELVPDGDLAERLHAQPLPQRAAAAMMQKIAAAVGHAHDAGVLHRDLKPSNILLEGDEPRVADFGLAGQLEPGADLTAATRALGTPAYLAPEAYLQGSKAASAASDVYALGAILYEMLTGRPPFLGDLAPSLTPREPIAPRLLAPAISRDLETVTLKCLEYTPGSRYANAGELAADLQFLLDGHPIVARPVSPLGHFTRWCRRRPALAMVWFLVVALALGALASAFAIARERDRAVHAEADAAGRLWQSELSEARALRGTHRTGQRNDALVALASAARHRVTPELRDAAIGALTQIDTKVTRTWSIRENPLSVWKMTPDFSGYITEPKPGLIELHDYPGDGLRATLDGTAWGKVNFISDFSPDGNSLLLRYADNHVRAWSLRERRVLASAEGPKVELRYGADGLVYDRTWRPDARAFACASPQGGFVVVSTETGLELGRWTSDVVATALAWSPDARTIAVASNVTNHVLLIDAASFSIQRDLTSPAVPRSLAWRPDGAELAVGCSDGALHIIGRSSGSFIREQHGHRESVDQAVYSPDGRLLVTDGRDATVRLWDGVTGELLLTIPGVGGQPDIAVSHDGRQLAYSHLDLEGVISNIASRDVVRTQSAVRQNDRGALFATMDFSPDGRWLAVASWSGVDVFDAATATRVASDLSNETDDEHSTQFSPDGRWLYVSSRERGVFRRPCLVSGGGFSLGPVQTLDSEKHFLMHAMPHDGTRLVLSNRKTGTAKLISSGDGKLLHRFDPQPELIDAALSADGRWLVTQSSGRGDSAALGPRLWSTGDWHREREFDVGPLGLMTFSGDGRWLAVAGLKGFREVRTTDWSEVAGPWPETVRKAGATSSFSADGELLAVTVDDKVFLIRASTGEKLALLESPTANASTARACLSRDGRRLAVLWDDASFDLWDLEKLRGELRAIDLDWR